MLNHGSDDAFLLMTGFTRASFYLLANAVLPQYQYRTGRSLRLNHVDQLGLYLFYVGSKLRLKDLAYIFYVLPCVASRIIQRMERLIVAALCNEQAAKISFPDEPTMARFAALVQNREPLVNNVIGFCDDVSVAIQCSSQSEDQNAFYDGYLHDTTINNVLVFSPEGKIFCAAINFPGSWHDSLVANRIINTSEAKLGHYAICVDQGFPRSGRMFDKFVGPISARMRRNLLPELREPILRKHALYVSLRQGAEWGMRSLQGTFTRLKARLTSLKTRRRTILLSILYLHNFRTHHVGLNQIATVFNPQYEQVINLEGNDRIARYYNM